MVLTVPFESFAEAAKRMHLPTPAYVAQHGNGTLATAANFEKGVILQAASPLPLEIVKVMLERDGMMCFHGQWSKDGEELDTPKSWLAAVAYKSTESRPGLWVDAFPDEPSTGEVMARMYDEFVDADEVDDVGLERFIQAAEPNVVVLSPEDQERFRARHQPSAAHTELTETADGEPELTEES